MHLLAEHYSVNYHDVRDAFLYAYGTTKRRDRFKAHVVSRLLGHRNYWYVRRWIRDGELAAVMGQSTRPTDFPDWYVTRADLLAFLHRQDKWMRWTPAAITDPSIRAYAQELRVDVPWRWLRSLDEGAAFFSCARRVVQSYILNGFLPGVVEGREWFIRSDHAATFRAKLQEYPAWWARAFRADPPVYAP